ncbi:hypothetical protein VNO78_31166 [Psophocarpus tetragonolobus]|uniref:Uncharacterized protein n=1 Tax=Psophocarpus tetragonolobus TaxID=3891 RepID=A0AAN9RYJ5_PSOTE
MKLVEDVANSQIEDTSKQLTPNGSEKDFTMTKPFDTNQWTFLEFEEVAGVQKRSGQLVPVWKDNRRRSLDGSHEMESGDVSREGNAEDEVYVEEIN